MKIFTGYNKNGDKMKIIAVGEIIFDIFDGEAEIGGAPLNFCAHCATLGAESALVSAVGNDVFAYKALNFIKDFEVDGRFIQKNGLPTGQCIVTVNNGQPSYNVISPASYDNIEITDDLINQIKSYNADILAFGTLIQRNPVSRRAVNGILKECKFSEIFCDVNLRPDCYDKESCLNCLEKATIIKISSEEEPLLRKFGLYENASSEKEIIENICKAFDNIKLVLYTKGADGSVIYDKSDFYEIPAVKANIVSTVGAGDSYSAAFLCEYMNGADIFEAALAGARLSAAVVSHREAVFKS